MKENLPPRARTAGEHPGMTKPSALVRAVPGGSLALLDALRAIPEERLWLEDQPSANTRAAYRNDVASFLAFLGVRTTAELRRVDRGAVIAWKRHLETSGAKASTIRRKLAALGSLFAHLVAHQVLHGNPCRDIKRPKVNRRQGTTSAFAATQARALLEAPEPTTLRGLRDRAILSVGLQAGARRSSIVRLMVRDLHADRGFDCLRFIWKGGYEHAVALHPQTAQRLREYLEASGHGADEHGPLFRPILRGLSVRRHLGADRVGDILRRYLKGLRIRGRYSAHSMRATFITRALENGASLEAVQEAAGHADPSTTRLYDRRGYNPEKSAAFFASY